jgi:hypothetical protein
MVPDPALWDVAKRVVGRFDAQGSVLAVVLDAEGRIEHAVLVSERGVVELEDEASLHDGLVLAAPGLSKRVPVLLGARVVVLNKKWPSQPGDSCG